MRSVRLLLLGALLVGAGACEDDPLKSRAPEAPAPLEQKIQAFLQVDRLDARVGEQIAVSAVVQLGTAMDSKLGSYTGRLRFDPAVLRYVDETKIDDGMRVTNPLSADAGEIRFAGAAAKGFSDLTIYQGTFEVMKTPYAEAVRLEIEELSEALSLTNLQPDLRVETQVFGRKR